MIERPGKVRYFVLIVWGCRWNGVLLVNVVGLEADIDNHEQMLVGEAIPDVTSAGSPVQAQEVHRRSCSHALFIRTSGVGWRRRVERCGMVGVVLYIRHVGRDAGCLCGMKKSFFRTGAQQCDIANHYMLLSPRSCVAPAHGDLSPNETVHPGFLHPEYDSIIVCPQWQGMGFNPPTRPTGHDFSQAFYLSTIPR